jgi:tetratricopeptide (TPR) repeat protein
MQAMVDSGALESADNLVVQGRFMEAISAYEAARTSRADEAYQAYIDLSVAQCLRKQGQATEALRQATGGLVRIAPYPSTQITALLLLTIANTAADIGLHPKALSAAQEAQRLFEELGDRNGLMQARISESRSLIATMRRDDAIDLIQQVLDDRDLQPQIRSQALSHLGVIYSQTDPQRARSCFQEDLEICGANGDEYGKAATLINLASLESSLGNSETAVVLLRSAVEAAQAANSAELIAHAYRNLHEIGGPPT